MRRLDDVVDELGLGSAQLRVGLLCGGSFAIAGAVLSLFGAVTEAIATEMGIGTLERGALVSAIFGGVVAGNLGSGLVGDRYGRRLPMLLAMVGVVVFSEVSTLARSFWPLFLGRFLIGAAMGLGGPAKYTLLTEVCPSTSRLLLSALSSLLWTVGCIWCTALLWSSDPQLVQLDWRWLTHACTLPGLPLVVAMYLWLPESPRYLDRCGRRAEAVKVLQHWRELNAKPSVDVEDWAATDLGAYDAGFVWSRALFTTTCTLCLSAFVINFSYYGNIYALPQILTGMEIGQDPVVSLLVASLMEVPATLAAVALGHCSRKASMLTYLSGVCVCSMMLSLAAPYVPTGDQQLHQEHWLPVFFVHASMYGSRFFVVIGWLFIYLYCVEVYPTQCRATGSAVTMAAGKIGAIICPIAFEALQALTGNHHSYFSCMGLLLLVNGLLVLWLPVETRDRQLSDISDSIRPLRQKGSP